MAWRIDGTRDKEKKNTWPKRQRTWETNRVTHRWHEWQRKKLSIRWMIWENNFWYNIKKFWTNTRRDFLAGNALECRGSESWLWRISREVFEDRRVAGSWDEDQEDELCVLGKPMAMESNAPRQELTGLVADAGVAKAKQARAGWITARASASTVVVIFCATSRFYGATLSWMQTSLPERDINPAKTHETRANLRKPNIPLIHLLNPIISIFQSSKS